MSELQVRQMMVAGTSERLLWFAVSWPGKTGDAPSRRAFEAAMQLADGTHTWRFKTPHQGPVKHWCVVAMGGLNRRQVMVDTAAAVAEVEGFEIYHPDQDLLQALALRRMRMMVDRTLAGDFGLKRIENRPRRLDRRGRMTDYKGKP